GRVAEMHRTVGEQTNAFANLINERSEQLHIALLDHGNVLREALGENAREAEAIMSASSARILSDVGALLDKLNQSNALLQQVLDASTGNLASLENAVASHPQTYSATVRDAIGSTEAAGKMVSEHVGALQNTIRSMVDEFGTLLGRLDTEAKSIDGAAASLNDASQLALGSLDERRTAMETLAQTFTARADDIDTRMRGFAEAISQTVAETEQRVLGARQSMEEALGKTSTSVAEVIGSATANLNEALVETTNRVDEALTDTTGRFTSLLASATGQMTNALDDNANRFGNVLAQAAEHMDGTLDRSAGRLSGVLAQATGEMTNALE